MKFEAADIVMIVGFVIFVVLFIWYLIGDSPTFEQMILLAIFFNIGLTFRNFGAISKLQGKFSEFKARFEEHLNGERGSLL